MNTDTVVFFYLCRKKVGRSYPWQRTEFVINRIKWGERTVVAAGIPEYDYRRKAWRKAVIKKKILKELIPLIRLECIETTSFMMHQSIFDWEHAGMLEQIFPFEQIDFSDKRSLAAITPEDIVETLIPEYCYYDALIVIDMAADCDDIIYPNLPQLVGACCNNVNYLAIITENEEKYAQVFEEINEEYGLNGMIFDRIERVNVSSKYKVLVIDAGAYDKKIWRCLPEGCTYLDLISSVKRHRIIESRRKDICYISFYRQILNMVREKISSGNCDLYCDL